MLTYCTWRFDWTQRDLSVRASHGIQYRSCHCCTTLTIAKLDLMMVGHPENRFSKFFIHMIVRIFLVTAWYWLLSSNLYGFCFVNHMTISSDGQQIEFLLLLFKINPNVNHIFYERNVFGHLLGPDLHQGIWIWKFQTNYFSCEKSKSIKIHSMRRTLHFERKIWINKKKKHSFSQLLYWWQNIFFFV